MAEEDVFQVMHFFWQAERGEAVFDTDSLNEYEQVDENGDVFYVHKATQERVSRTQKYNITDVLLASVNMWVCNGYC